MTLMMGEVVRGQKAGRLLGFPTANIKISFDVAFAPGVYAGHVIIRGKKYQSALYLAEDLSLQADNIIEAFIFNFSGDLYGREVQVEILKKIRDKQDFKDDKEAIHQITKDVLEIKEFFRYHP